MVVLGTKTFLTLNVKTGGSGCGFFQSVTIVFISNIQGSYLIKKIFLSCLLCALLCLSAMPKKIPPFLWLNSFSSHRRFHWAWEMGNSIRGQMGWEGKTGMTTKACRKRLCAQVGTSEEDQVLLSRQHFVFHCKALMSVFLLHAVEMSVLWEHWGSTMDRNKVTWNFTDKANNEWPLLGCTRGRWKGHLYIILCFQSFEKITLWVILGFIDDTRPGYMSQIHTLGWIISKWQCKATRSCHRFSALSLTVASAQTTAPGNLKGWYLD